MTVPELSTQGTWSDEPDIRPTLLSLVGLRDDYRSDGRVITEIMRHVPRALAGTQALGEVFKQLNSAVGDFGTDTMIADSAALASGSSSNDQQWIRTEQALRGLGFARTIVATRISQTLNAAAFDGRAPSWRTVATETAAARALLAAAHQLKAHAAT
jgi:hypothetical protein